MAALTAFNRKVAALTALNRNDSGVNRVFLSCKCVDGVKPELSQFQRNFFVGIKALTVFNRKNSGDNGVEPEKKRR